MGYIDHLDSITKEDVAVLKKKDAEYGGSWLKRGGIGAYMMAARKADRLEVSVLSHGYDVFAAAAVDKRDEGILDDIRDLRRYLILIEAEILERTPKPRSTIFTETQDHDICRVCGDIIRAGGHVRDMPNFEGHRHFDCAVACPKHPADTCISPKGYYYCRVCDWNTEVKKIDGQTHPFGYDPAEDNPMETKHQ